MSFLLSVCSFVKCSFKIEDLTFLIVPNLIARQQGYSRNWPVTSCKVLRDCPMNKLTIILSSAQTCKQIQLLQQQFLSTPHISSERRKQMKFYRFMTYQMSIVSGEFKFMFSVLYISNEIFIHNVTRLRFRTETKSRSQNPKQNFRPLN